MHKHKKREETRSASFSRYRDSRQGHASRTLARCSRKIKQARDIFFLPACLPSIYDKYSLLLILRLVHPSCGKRFEHHHLLLT